jgi:hypothetical protein
MRISFIDLVGSAASVVTSEARACFDYSGEFCHDG